MILISDYTHTPITRCQAILLRELITFPDLVTFERLIYALWGFSPEGWDAPVGAHGALLTHICKMRPNLHERVKIESKHDVGYSLRLLEKAA